MQDLTTIDLNWNTIPYLGANSFKLTKTSGQIHCHGSLTPTQVKAAFSAANTGLPSGWEFTV
jgi:hypothetical protein